MKYFRGIICFCILIFLIFGTAISYKFKGFSSNLIEPTKYFTGREESLKEVQQLLRKNGIVTIIGPTGFGKTQLSRKYANLHRQDYDIIWWFDGNKDSFIQFKSLAENINNSGILKQKIQVNSSSEILLIKEVCEFIKKYRKKTLFIFDNAPNIGSIEKYVQFWKSSHQVNVLVTSKNVFGWDSKYVLKPLNDEEALHYLEKILDKRSSQKLKDLTFLAKGYPLVLLQLSSYLKEHPFISEESYINLFKTNRKNLWKSEKDFMRQNRSSGNPLDQYHATVDVALGLSIDDIKKKSFESYEFLMLLSFLYNQSLTRPILWDLYKAYTQKSYIQFQETLDDILSVSILEKPKNSSPFSEEFIFIHEITQFVSIDAISKEEKEKYVIFLAKFLKSYFLKNRNNLIGFFTKERHIINHTESIIKHGDDLKILDSNIIELKIFMMNYYLYIKRDHDFSLKLIKNIEKNLHKVKIDPIILADYYTNKGDVCSLHFAPKSKEFSEVLKEMLKVWADLSGKKGFSKEKIRVLYNIAQNYLLKGDYKNARIYLTKAEPYLSEVSNSNKIHYYYYQSWRFQLENNPEEVKKYSEKGLSLLSDEPDSPIKFYMLVQLAHSLLTLKKHEEAFKVAKLSYDKCLKYFDGHGSDIIGEDLNIMAAVSLKQNRLKDAEKFIKQAIESFKKSRPLSEDEGFSHVIYGNTLVKMKRYLEAKREYEIAEKIYLDVFQDQKNKRISQLFISQTILGIHLKDEVWANRYFAWHRKIFGETHEGTKEIVDLLSESGFPVIV